jgi:hypothetical protein
MRAGTGRLSSPGGRGSAEERRRDVEPIDAESVGEAIALEVGGAVMVEIRRRQTAGERKPAGGLEAGDCVGGIGGEAGVVEELDFADHREAAPERGGPGGEPAHGWQAGRPQNGGDIDIATARRPLPGGVAAARK